MPSDGPEAVDGRTWRCKVCGRTFESRAALREHVESIGLVR